MIRLASNKDSLRIRQLCQEFFLESPYQSLSFDLAYVESQISLFLADPNKVVILLEKGSEIVGILAGLVTSLPLSPARIAAEIVWYVQPEHRGRESLSLLSAYEYWATEVMKVDFITVSNLVNLDLSKFYEKRGYMKTETAYMKQVYYVRDL